MASASVFTSTQVQTLSVNDCNAVCVPVNEQVNQLFESFRKAFISESNTAIPLTAFETTPVRPIISLSHNPSADLQNRIAHQALQIPELSRRHSVLLTTPGITNNNYFSRSVLTVTAGAFTVTGVNPTGANASLSAPYSSHLPFAYLVKITLPENVTSVTITSANVTPTQVGNVTYVFNDNNGCYELVFLVMTFTAGTRIYDPNAGVEGLWLNVCETSVAAGTVTGTIAVNGTAPATLPAQVWTIPYSDNLLQQIVGNGVQGMLADLSTPPTSVPNS